MGTGKSTALMVAAAKRFHQVAIILPSVKLATNIYESLRGHICKSGARTTIGYFIDSCV